jgi:hypothetical protein
MLTLIKVTGTTRSDDCVKPTFFASVCAGPEWFSCFNKVVETTG